MHMLHMLHMIHMLMWHTFLRPPGKCNGDRFRRECCRSLVQSPVGTNQTMKLTSTASRLMTQHKREMVKTGQFGFTIMCQIGATYLHIDCCCSDPALYKCTKSNSTRWSSTNHVTTCHQTITCSYHDKLLIWCQTTISYSLTFTHSIKFLNVAS